MGSDEEMTRKPTAHDHSALAAQLLAEREYEHPSGWWPLKVEIEEYLATKDAEIERLKAKNVELLDHANAVNSDCEQLEAENATLKAQLAASEEKRKVLGVEVNFIRHHFGATEEEGCLMWMNCDNATLAEYERLSDATDAANALEAP